MTSEVDPPADEPGAGPSGDGTDTGDEHPVARGAPSRRALALVVGPLIGLVIAAQIGDALGPDLISRNPLLLIALNSRVRWLVLAVNQVEPVPFFVVGTLRNLASDPLFYVLGYWYGDSAVRWMENRTENVGRMMRGLERSFGRWGAPLVLIAPNNPICLLAGAARMRPAVFLTLNLTGTIGRLALIKIFGEAFETPINYVLDFIRDYRIPLLILSVVVVGISMFTETRKGTSEIEQLRHLESDLTPGGDGAERTVAGDASDDGPGADQREPEGDAS
jgi:membrane protein DedA with SNARE-associated domain